MTIRDLMLIIEGHSLDSQIAIHYDGDIRSDVDAVYVEQGTIVLAAEQPRYLEGMTNLLYLRTEFD
jgi:hypothetical protein